MADVTQILSAIERGDPKAAAELLPLVYDELRKLAAARLAEEKPGQTLQATALVHEAYLRLVGGRTAAGLERPRPLLRRRRRGHAPHPRRARPRQGAAQARRRPAAGRPRRTSTSPPPAPPDDLLALDEALDRLAAADPLAAELVKLRYFAGLTLDQAAAALGISTADGRPRTGRTPAPGCATSSSTDGTDPVREKTPLGPRRHSSMEATGRRSRSR